jgi:multicomponent Na+:H+ antiporter subunit B
MAGFLDVVILVLMSVTAFSILRSRNLFGVVILSGIFSLLAASFYVLLAAVDVAFTEASVGAGISTLLMLATLAITHQKKEKQHINNPIMPIIVVLVTGAALVYGTLDMPLYGDINAPSNQYLIQRFIEQSGAEIGIPNIVTSILASYRGYDTLGETFVIFTAAIGVLTLLGRGRTGNKAEVKQITSLETDGEKE